MTTEEEPQDLIEAYLQARDRRDHAQAQVDEYQARLIKQMEADQRKTIKWVEDNRTHQVTYIHKAIPVIDERGLRKALTAKVFDKFTKKVLDRKAMEVTETHSDYPEPRLGLAVLNPTGVFFDRNVRQSEEKHTGGTWHWPCVIAEEGSE
jgi:hypothetical protein